MTTHPEGEGKMPCFRAKSKAPSARISQTNITDETLTARAGMALFSRYLAATGPPAYLAALLAPLRKSGKGIALADLFKQLLCFFFDGTSLHLTFLDRLKEKAGYAAAIETRPEEMASSHQAMRLLAKFTIGPQNDFRCVLRELCRWRLKDLIFSRAVRQQVHDVRPGETRAINDGFSRHHLRIERDAF